MKVGETEGDKVVGNDAFLARLLVWVSETRLVRVDHATILILLDLRLSFSLSLLLALFS